jgi:hypothetical protein
MDFTLWAAIMQTLLNYANILLNKQALIIKACIGANNVYKEGKE